jgi:regulator of protease activity HflC (stomatin/prohibitin superfamily)
LGDCFLLTQHFSIHYISGAIVFFFVCSIVVLLISAAWFIFAGPHLRPYGFIGVGLAVLLFVLSFFAVVGTRNIGVEKFMSATTGETHEAGLVVKAPWNSVEDVDATIQAEEYKGDSCIYVKIADGGSACITLAYRWRINPKGAAVAYVDYHKSDDGILEGIRKALVSTNIKAAINEVLGKYDPLAGAALEPGMTPQELANVKINVVPDYQQINADIKANVEEKIADLGDLIDIESVTVSYVKLPDSTQDRINAFNKAVQDTKIAMQEVATKQAQADANKVLAASLQDPNVLVSKCLDGLISGDIKAPAGFQCFPNSGSSVVLPAAK